MNRLDVMKYEEIQVNGFPKLYIFVNKSTEIMLIHKNVLFFLMTVILSLYYIHEEVKFINCKINTILLFRQMSMA